MAAKRVASPHIPGGYNGACGVGMEWLTRRGVFEFLYECVVCNTSLLS